MSGLIHDFRAKMEFKVRQSWQNFSEGLLIGRGVFVFRIRTGQGEKEPACAGQDGHDYLGR